MPTHTNPADKLAIVAASPLSILDKKVTITYMAQECQKQLQHNSKFNLSESILGSILSRRFTIIEE